MPTLTNTTDSRDNSLARKKIAKIGGNSQNSHDDRPQSDHSYAIRVRFRRRLDIDMYEESDEEMLMTDTPATRASLLLRMRDAKDYEAWHTFVELYAPLVYRFARKRGLQDADAADLTQEVLGSVADAMKSCKYDVARGSFRGWLFTVTRNAVHKLLRRGKRQPIGSGDSHIRDRLEQVAAPDEREEWENEFQKRLFAWACDEVRSEFKEHTWQAFWQTAVNNKGVKMVSQQLGMSAGSIYVAKSRILMRIKEKITQTEIELPATGAKHG